MAELKIEWGAIRFKGKADVVARELESIGINSAGDEAKPQDIVDYARSNPESELHKCFTWDDSEAAEKWRRQEARIIVANIVYSDEQEENEKPVKVRWALRTDTTGGYKQTVAIMRNDDEYEKLLLMARNELKNFERKYATLSDSALKPVFAAIDAI